MVDLNKNKQRLRALRRPLTANGYFTIKQGLSVPPITVPSTYRLNFFPAGDRKKKQFYVPPTSRPLSTPFATLDDLKIDPRTNISEKKLAYKVVAPYSDIIQETVKKRDYVLKSPYATNVSFNPKMQRDSKLIPPYALHTDVPKPCPIETNKNVAYKLIAPYSYTTIGDD